MPPATSRERSPEPLPRRSIRACLLLAAACAATTPARAAFTDVTAAAGIDAFERVTRPLGTEEFVVRGGHPIAMDFDGDGWQDLYIVRFGLPDILYRNVAGQFTRIDTPLGIDTANGGNAGAWVDIDNDGKKDLVIATADEKRYRLYLNQGGGVFEEAAETRGIALPSIVDHKGTSVTAGDINRDGYLDILMGDWGVEVTAETAQQHYGLFLNGGSARPGYFANITETAGIDFGASAFFFTPTISDLDMDGWPDLAIVADFGRSALYWNDADDTFTNSTTVSGVGKENHGMGTAIGDIDNDGDLDWFVTTIAMDYSPPNSEVNRLYINEGGRSFRNASQEAGVHFGGWGWGTNMFDYDNDGDLDIVMVNNQNAIQVEGLGRPIKDAPMKLWRNDGGLKFTDVSDLENVNHIGWGVGILHFDYDNDGDLDLFAVHQFSGPVLLRNDRPSPRNWLRLSLQGVLSNRDAFGAFVTIQPTANGPIQVREFNPTNAYMAQLEPFLHFGLGNHSSPIHRLTVRWPSSIVQTLSNVSPNQVLHILEDPELLAGTEIPVFSQQPTPETVTARHVPLSLSVAIEGGFQPAITWFRNGVLLPGQSGPTLTIDSVRSSDAGLYHAVATNAAGSTPSSPALVAVRTPFPSKSIARQWNEAMLDASRINFPDPPIVARNFYHVSAALWDAFWPYQPEGWTHAQPLFHREDLVFAQIEGIRESAQAESMSFAAYRVASKRFENAFNSAAIQLALRDLMLQLGYDPDDTTLEGSSPAAVGNRIAQAILLAGLADGSNEANAYADTSGYAPVNQPIVFGQSGTIVADPNRWQPLNLARSVTKNGIEIGPEIQTFLAPHWNRVTPFALQKPTVSSILIDPGQPPLFGSETQADYIAQAVQVIRASSVLDPSDGVTFDASPGAPLQNNPFLTHDGQGHPLNPATGLPYAPNIVKRGDYFRLASEFWSDGPGIEGPPGVWNMVHNEVTDDPRFVRRLGGVGPILSPLEWDVHAYLALTGAIHDSAIAAWAVKAKYDSARPITMIRHLAGLGQSSDPGSPRYHTSGLPLVPGLIELVTPESAAPGQRHAHLAEHLDQIALYAWRGGPPDPRSDVSGAGWILGADWVPYHLRTFPTPAFAGYVSGHSTFSRAGAEVMSLLTGSPYFPGGLKEYHFQQGEVLQVEYGPSEDVTFQVATYYDAADLTGLARIYCGVHIAADDFPGRQIGARAGADAYLKMLALRQGTAAPQGIQNPRLTLPVAPGADAATAAFAYPDPTAPSLPIRSAPDAAPGLYFVESAPPLDTISIIAMGRPVSAVQANGPIRPDQPLAIYFQVDSDEPVHLLASGSLGTLHLFHLDEVSAATILQTNPDWRQDPRASLAAVFAARPTADAHPLPNASPALALALARGAYRLDLSSDQAVPAATLSLKIAAATP